MGQVSRAVEAYRKAEAAHSEKRAGFNAEIGPVPWGGYERKLFQQLWNKHGLEPVCEAWNREDRKLRRIAKAIRKAKAESPFGIGVKLSAWEDWGDISEGEFAEVVDNVRRDLAALSGVDFIAATGELDT